MQFRVCDTSSARDVRATFHPLGGVFVATNEALLSTTVDQSSVVHGLLLLVFVYGLFQASCDFAIDLSVVCWIRGWGLE